MSTSPGPQVLITASDTGDVRFTVAPAGGTAFMLRHVFAVDGDIHLLGVISAATLSDADDIAELATDQLEDGAFHAADWGGVLRKVGTYLAVLNLSGHLHGPAALDTDPTTLDRCRAAVDALEGRATATV